MINDDLCKDYTITIFVDFSDVNPTTHWEFKTSSLNGSEYFTSLEIPRKSKSGITLKTAIPVGNIASKLFDELSHSNFNNGEYNSSIDTLISTKDNSFMVAQLTWTRSSQTIEALNCVLLLQEY